MRIGLVIYGSLEILSGGYLYDRHLAAGLRDLGETVEVLSLPWRNYTAHLSDNIHWRLPPDFDILIQDELNHPSLISANRRPHPYPVVSLVHHLRSSEQHPALLKRFYRWIEKRYLQSVDGFIYNSRTTRGVVERLIGSNKPGVIAFPPTDRFGSGLSEDQIIQRAANSSTLRVIFLGNLIPRKGLHTLIEAVGLCGHPLQLDVVGSLAFDPVYSRRMQETAAEISTKHRIRFHGALEDQDLAGKLSRSDLLAVPSEYEGFGIVYLEGMAFGLPAVGTTAGAAGEIIQEGETGFLIKSGDAHRLAEILIALSEDRLLLGELSIKAKQRYLQQPTWQETVREIHQFLQQQVEAFRIA